MKKKSIIFIVVILVFLMVVGAAVGLVLHKRMSHNTEVSDLTVGDSPEGEEYAAEEPAVGKLFLRICKENPGQHTKTHSSIYTSKRKIPG